MRDSLTGAVAAIALGGTVALGLTAGQDTVQRQTESSGASAASSLTQASITVTPDTIDCTEFIAPGECRTTIVVRPSTAVARRTLTVYATLVKGDGDDVPVVVSTECAKGCAGDKVYIDAEPATAVRVTLHLPSDWRAFTAPQVGWGLLGIIGDNRFDGAPKRLRVLAPSPSYWQWVVVLLPLALAVVVAVDVAARLRRDARVSIFDRMGAPSWKASESWSSNLTVGAGLANGVLALAVVSEFTVFMTKPSYAVLSMLLGSFVLLAPIVYGISRRRVEGKPGENPPPPPNPLVLQAPAVVEFEGSVGVFLIAGVLTLWASGGQLITFALLMVELWRFGALSAPLAVIVVALALLVLLGLLWHGAATLFEAASKATPAKTDTAAGQREETGRAASAPGWTFL